MDHCMDCDDAEPSIHVEPTGGGPMAGEKRNAATGLKRGFLGRCPNCGEGHLFRAFVKVADHCEKCGEVFRYHRADDFPAYLVIVLVGHIVVPLSMWVEIAYSPAYWVHAI